MGKIVRRLIQDDFWNLGRNESWFSDMAEQGLHLRRIGPVFVFFEKAEPRKTKYRIDFISPAPTTERLALYQDCGWQFVTKCGALYVFSSPEDANAPELHTDPMEQSYTLAEVNRQLKIQAYSSLGFLVLFLVLILAMFFLEHTPTLSMLSVLGLEGPLLMLVEFYVTYTAVRNYLSLRKLKASLSAGRSLNHREAWRGPRRISAFISAVFFLVALLTLCLPFTALAQQKSYTLPEEGVSLPVVRLADIERDAALERETQYNQQGVDWYNSVNATWSLLAPVQYEINEHGTIANKMWADNSGTYSPSLETHYYKLTFSGMADSLVDDLMDRYVHDFDPKVTVYTPANSTFDLLFVAEDGIRTQIFACVGNEVVYISYFGEVPTEDLLALLPQIFNRD